MGDDMERSKEIENLVAEWFAGASKGDASLVSVHVSADVGTRLIGSDPAEVFSGGAAVAAFLRGEVTNAGGQVRFEPADIDAFEEGSVGWATAGVKITLPDGKSVNPRWSSVFHREEGIWKFVQIHASIAIPNDQVGWVYSG